MPAFSGRTGLRRRSERVNNRRRLLTAAAALALGLTVVPVGFAGDWINPAGGVWQDPSNWAGGIVPAATTDTAEFDIPGQYTVTLDNSPLVGGVGVTKGAVSFNVGSGLNLQMFGFALDGADAAFTGGGRVTIGDPGAPFPASPFTLNNGQLAVSGALTEVNSFNDLELGTIAGNATLLLSDSAVLGVRVLRAGVVEGANSWIRVSDADNNTLLKPKATVIGVAGAATLSIVNEGRFNADPLLPGGPAITIGYGDAAGRGTGFVEVVGNKSLMNIKGTVMVGDGGDGMLVVRDGGRAAFSGVTRVESAMVVGNRDGDGRVLVTGAGSSVRLNGALTINQGNDQTTVRVENGGQVRADRLVLRSDAPEGAAPAVVVSGADATLGMQGKIDLRNGVLRIENGGTVEAGIGLRLAADGGKRSRVEFNGGSLRVGELTMSGGDLLLATGGDKLVRTGRVYWYSEQGAIDLADNAMMVDYFEFETSPLDGVRSAIAPQAGGAGAARIRSSTAAADPVRFALGTAEGADLPSTGDGVRTFFREAADNTSVLVRYTYRGDGNLDGAVDLGDFARLAAHFNQQGRWFDGDFNYDGSVNVADFAAMASNFGQTLPGTGGTTARPGAVPEPAALGLLALAAGAMLRRGRRG